MGFYSGGRGKGSTFYFEIPLYPTDGGALGSGSSASLHRHRLGSAHADNATGEAPSSAHSKPKAVRRKTFYGRTLHKVVAEGLAEGTMQQQEQELSLDELLQGKDQRDVDGEKEVPPPLVEEKVKEKEKEDEKKVEESPASLWLGGALSVHIGEEDDWSPKAVPERFASGAASPNRFLMAANGRMKALGQASPSLHGAPLRILVVDDSPLNRKMLQRLIVGERTGWLAHATVIEADDGVTAIERVRAEMEKGTPFDFVLMDFIMVHSLSLLFPLRLAYYPSFCSRKCTDPRQLLFFETSSST